MRSGTSFVSMAVCLVLGFAGGYSLRAKRERSGLERNKAIVRRIHQEVWSNPDNKAAAEAVDQFFAPDFVRHSWRGVTRGLPEFNSGLLKWRAAFPDWSEHVEDIIAEGDFVVTRFTSDGTQRGDLAAVPGLSPAIPAKGRPLRITELNLWRIANGKASEQWDVYDRWGALIQLGLIDPERICPAGLGR
jgi:predicted ester cyclase